MVLRFQCPCARLECKTSKHLKNCQINAARAHSYTNIICNMNMIFLQLSQKESSSVEELILMRLNLINIIDTESPRNNNDISHTLCFYYTRK